MHPQVLFVNKFRNFHISEKHLIVVTIGNFACICKEIPNLCTYNSIISSENNFKRSLKSREMENVPYVPLILFLINQYILKSNVYNSKVLRKNKKSWIFEPATIARNVWDPQMNHVFECSLLQCINRMILSHGQVYIYGQMTN